jgi:UDP-glucose 4-epimerase
VKRVLVTGGSGFIGSHLVLRLRASGNSDIHVFARSTSDVRRIRQVLPEITLWRGDLNDRECVKQCVEAVRPEIVFHLAGHTAGRRWSANLAELDRSIDTNLHGTLNLIRVLHDGAQPPSRFIRAGGLAEYGDAPAPFDEAQRELPVSAYGASQAATTMFLSALSRQLSFPAITLRFAAVYGPGRNEDFFLPSLIVRCLAGRDFEMTAGDQPWDLIYIDDAVDALMKASSAPVAAGEIINIGSGRAQTLREIAELVVNKIGGPARLKVGAISVAAGDVRQLYCRIEKANSLLAWRPQVALNEGLDRTIEWYRRQSERPDLNP